MNDDRSVNLNTRNINVESDSKLRVIKTNLAKVPPSGSKFAVLELSTKAVKLLIGEDVESIRDNILGAATSGARFNFANFFRNTDKVDTGKGLDKQNEMDMRYFSGRVFRSIQHKIMLMLDKHVDTVYTVATAAYRTATNRAEILDFIRARTGINVRILTKEEESQATLFAYTFTSAYRRQLLASPNVIMIDQGGGSTEVSVFRTNCIHAGNYSVNLGTTALRNFLFQISNPDTPIEQAFKSCKGKARERLSALYRNLDGNIEGEVFCVGVGTAITRAVGGGGNAKQHDKILTRELITARIATAEKIILERAKTVGELYEVLSKLGPNDPFDAEVTTRLGLPIFLAIMEKYNISEIHVCGTGLWYGIYFQALLDAIDEN